MPVYANVELRPHVMDVLKLTYYRNNNAMIVFRCGGSTAAGNG
jgi:hypothetical protein